MIHVDADKHQSPCDGIVLGRLAAHVEGDAAEAAAYAQCAQMHHVAHHESTQGYYGPSVHHEVTRVGLRLLDEIAPHRGGDRGNDGVLRGFGRGGAREGELKRIDLAPPEADVMVGGDPLKGGVTSSTERSGGKPEVHHG